MRGSALRANSQGAKEHSEVVTADRCQGAAHRIVTNSNSQILVRYIRVESPIVVRTHCNCWTCPMSSPSSCRYVTLIDLRVPGRPLIKAELYRDYPLSQLVIIEAQWSQAREKAAMAGLITGLTPLEHAHWDWRNKAESVEAVNHMLVAVECEDEPQGVMAVLRTPRPAQLDAGQVVYVDYSESAP